ncbi:MAG: type II secretion system protein [Sedimentisphaerales bacterium]
MSKQKGEFDAVEVKVSNHGRGRFQEAFTLVELLVVISIIAMLLAILIPSLQRARKQAKTVICRSNLKQWGIMYTMYCDDNRGYFFSGQINDSWTAGANFGRYWRNVMKPYSKNAGMWLCSETIKPQFNGDMPVKGSSTSVAWEYDGDVGSYGLNGWVLNPPPDTTDVYSRTPVSDSWRTYQKKGLNNIPVFGDMWFVDAWPKDADPPPLTETCPGDPETYAQSPPNEMRRVCVNRHNGYVNMVFMDSSARKVGLKELWVLKWNKSYNINGKYTKVGRFRSENWPDWMRKFKDY